MAGTVVTVRPCWVFTPLRRRDSTTLFVDVSNMHPLLDVVQKKITEDKQKVPDWDKANPVVRIGRFRLIEESNSN